MYNVYIIHYFILLYLVIIYGLRVCNKHFLYNVMYNVNDNDNDNE